jgi:hypothetical protein
MKKILVVLCASLLLLGFVGSASADWVSSDVFDAGHKKLYQSTTAEWWATLNDYDPSTQYLTEAWLYLWLSGDNDTNPETGELRVSTDNLFEATLSNPNIDQWVPLYVGVDWLQDGSTRFTLLATVGDFYIDYAKVSANAEYVPEPATMLLLGTGLLGLVGLGRKRFLKK